MNRKNLRQFAFMMGTVALTACFAGAAQTATTTTTTPLKKVPPPAHAAKPAPAAKLASTPIPARSTAVMARPASAAAGIPAARKNSASSQPMLPNLGGSPTSAINGSSAVAPANTMAAPGSGARTAPVSGDPRAPVVAQGVGTFQFRDFTLTAYGCFRTGTRALCDFDATKQDSVQFNAEKLWYAVVLVDDGGRVTKRHAAYFVGDDGSPVSNRVFEHQPGSADHGVRQCLAPVHLGISGEREGPDSERPDHGHRCRPTRRHGDTRGGAQGAQSH